MRWHKLQCIKAIAIQGREVILNLVQLLFAFDWYIIGLEKTHRWNFNRLESIIDTLHLIFLRWWSTTATIVMPIIFLRLALLFAASFPVTHRSYDFKDLKPRCLIDIDIILAWFLIGKHLLLFCSLNGILQNSDVREQPPWPSCWVTPLCLGIMLVVNKLTPYTILAVEFFVESPT